MKRIILGIILAVIVVILLLCLLLCRIYGSTVAITVATILSAVGTITMAVFVGWSIFQSSEQHNETLKEMQTSREESRKPMLKPIMNVIEESAKLPRYTLSIKNVGLGPATEVDVWWHWCELTGLPPGVVESEEKWPRTNPIGVRKLPPLGPNEVFDVGPIGPILDKRPPRPPGHIYIHLKYMDAYEKVKERYYKCDTGDMIMTNISKEEWDKWMKLTKEQ